MGALLVGLTWALLASVGSRVCAEGATRAPFTLAERAQLAKGQLVTRAMTEERTGLRLIGGSSWQVVDVAPAQLFRALLDTAHYDRMFPAVSGAALISEHPTLRRVRFEHKRALLGIAYRLALHVDRGRRDITFKLNDPLDSGVRAAWGFLSVQPYGHDKSILSYGVMADPGDGLVVGLARGVIHEWLLKVPQQVRYFVEGKTGRALYGSRTLGRCAYLDGGQPKQCAP